MRFLNGLGNVGIPLVAFLQSRSWWVRLKIPIAVLSFSVSHS